MLRDRVRRGEIKSLADLRDTVMTKVPGEIVSTSVDQENGATVYDFRILNSANRLVEVEVDAASGVILEIENDE
ncbi:PepSY domain-containing protein [Rhizobium sp. 18055]|uniref:PepSY domain-containing protein n=1 Tax=Rhizobium sp. 18055 TaxID=2681403 RepID=UPI002453177A|nr:PepSY domain-containing protein [Rhizobium sp. 18055]